MAATRAAMTMERMEAVAAMLTALDADPSKLDEHEQEFVASIRKHGWSSTNVFAEDGYPGFCYTTGLWKTLACPEVIVFSLRAEIAHQVLWNIFRACGSGSELAQRVPLADVLEANDVILLPVDKQHYPEHLGWSRWFYGGDEFPCVQLVWPDRNNFFPWQSGCDASVIRDQQDLTERGWGGLASRN